ncbi:MAG: hypothetical protein JRN38_03810, partial [Nitrososphaerota archaeon]|nr:hypothetical protein [Nitrososphaerota archaeon]
SDETQGLVPRIIRPMSLPGAPRLVLPKRPSAELTKTILDEVSRYESANRQSVVSYLSVQFLPADVAAEIDRLHSEGYLVLEPKEAGGGPKILSYTVTETGRRLLQGLSG